MLCITGANQANKAVAAHCILTDFCYRTINEEVELQCKYTDSKLISVRFHYTDQAW